MRNAPALLPLLAMLGACASDTVFPSLAPRPVETRPAAPAEEAEAPATPDPALDGQVAARTAAADAATGAFADALARTRAAIDRPGATRAGTEAWLTAQQALTQLGTAREPVAAAIADLQAAQLAAAARDRPVDTARLDAALERLTRIAAEQDAAYQALARRLPNG